MRDKIASSVLSGTKDRLPDEMLRRNTVMNTIRGIFEKYGLCPIETPVICPAATITGSDTASDKLVYRFNQHDKTDIALPYDLTVPFARFVAAHYKKLPMPFKRYQIQRVWRAERPQRGRLREFCQCDADIVGSKSLICEAEILRLAYDVLSTLGIKAKLKINSRRLTNCILEVNDVSASQRMQVLRIIDKFDRDGCDSVINQLQSHGIDNAEFIMELLRPCASNNATLDALNIYDTAELQALLGHCAALGIPSDTLYIDPTLTRGLDYYTGMVFEAVPVNGSLGSLCAGGRYDNLCERFTEQDISGVGVSFGFDRIMLYLEQFGARTGKTLQSPAQVLVTIFDDSCTQASLKTYKELLNAGVASEIFFDIRPLGKQLQYAVKQNIPFAIIQGRDEIDSDVLLIKRLGTGKQKMLSTHQVVDYLVNYYEA